MDKLHQRIGAVSNAQVGRDFEQAAKQFFQQEGLLLRPNLVVPVGVERDLKDHAFDLGCHSQKVLVECKSHRWTAPNDNVPSAKLTVWNEAMFYFLLSPPDYRKIMFVLRHLSTKRGETLAEYYIRTYRHLIPSDVEVWEYDELTKSATQLQINKSELQPREYMLPPEAF
mgnify:FL=1